MNLLHALANANLWQLAGWTMIHFLWIGALAGLTTGVCRLTLFRASANLRYAVAVACFAVLAALPILIGCWLISHDAISTAAIVQPAVVDQAGESSKVMEVGSSDMNPSAPGTVGNVPQRAIDSDAAILPTPSIVPHPGRGLTGLILPAAVGQSVAILESCARYLPWVWLAGAPLTFALLASGVVGAERLRRGSRLVVEGPIVDACARLVDALDTGRRVSVAVCERIAAPVLVGIVRPMILLPPAAITGWSPDEIEMVLLHELAHVRRWDNLVNLVQRLVESLLFFHLAVWLVSRWVRREREACCDSVVIGRTNRPHAYAEMLVALAAQMPRSVLFHPAATSAMAHGPLRGRIRRILQLEDDPMLVSGKSLVVLMSGLLLATTLVWLNLSMCTLARESTGETNGNPSTEGVEESSILGGEDAATNSAIPSPTDQKLAEVPFVQGATRFKDGDKITVQEVHGTAASFEPGNVYWITGTYTLGSRDRAALSAFTTARDSANGTGPILKIQTTAVHRGSGTFTLCLPMSCRGWPHLSFYPDDGGESFGGTYFGTGDSVLKEWWGSKDATEPASSAAGTSSGSARFPSLEDQKLADLAYRALRMELEPVSGEDLKRVKRLGYDGGLAIRGGPAVNDLAVLKNDILVGLHVWPTTSLASVVEILNRNDVGELNPLKFYVVRTSGPEGQDTEVTGRINANVPTIQRQSTSDNPFAVPTLWQEAHPATPASDQSRYSAPSNLYSAPAGAPALPPAVPADVSQRVPMRPTVERFFEPQAVPIPNEVSDDDAKRAVEQITNTRGVRSASVGQANDGTRMIFILYERSPDEPRHPLVDWVKDEQGEFHHRVRFVTVPPLNATGAPVVRPADPGEAARPVAPNTYTSTKVSPPFRLMYFYAPGAAGPADIEPALDSLEKHYPGMFNILRIDVHNDPAQAQSHRINQVPACLIYHGDDEVVRLEDVSSAKRLMAAIYELTRAADGESVSVISSAAKPALHYDGKTFGEWQKSWHTELSTARRIETVSALAAFGASGYGRDAAESILNVSGQYEWSLNDLMLRSSRKNLQGACLAAFVPTESDEGGLQPRIPSDDFLTVFQEALERGATSRQKHFMALVLAMTGDSRSMDMLDQLANDDDPGVQALANAIKKSRSAQQQEEPAKVETRSDLDRHE